MTVGQKYGLFSLRYKLSTNYIVSGIPLILAYIAHLVIFTHLKNYLYKIYYHMRNFLNKLLTLGIFIIAIGFFYLSTTVAFPSAFINIALFVMAIFVLLQGCANVDKENGFGKYSHTNESSNNTDDKTTEN